MIDAVGSILEGLLKESLNYVPKWSVGNEYLKQMLKNGAGCTADALRELLSYVPKWSVGDEYLKQMLKYGVGCAGDALRELLKYVPKWCVVNEYAKQVLKFGAGCAGDPRVVCALGLVVMAWVLWKLVLNNPGKLMKAPGKGGAYIPREGFEKDPKAYFRALHGKASNPSSMIMVVY